MGSSVDRSEFTVIRLGERYTDNWPAEVRQAVAVLAGFVEASLADEAKGPGAQPADQQSGSALRESAEREAAKRSDAETAHPETIGAGGSPLRPRGSFCGAIDSGPPVGTDGSFCGAIDSGPPVSTDGSFCGAIDSGQVAPVAPDSEIVLVRGLNAYETVSQALG